MIGFSGRDSVKGNSILSQMGTFILEDNEENISFMEGNTKGLPHIFLHLLNEMFTRAVRLFPHA